MCVCGEGEDLVRKKFGSRNHSLSKNYTFQCINVPSDTREISVGQSEWVGGEVKVSTENLN